MFPSDWNIPYLHPHKLLNTSKYKLIWSKFISQLYIVNLTFRTNLNSVFKP